MELRFISIISSGSSVNERHISLCMPSYSIQSRFHFTSNNTHTYSQQNIFVLYIKHLYNVYILYMHSYTHIIHTTYYFHTEDGFVEMLSVCMKNNLITSSLALAMDIFLSICMQMQNV